MMAQDSRSHPRWSWGEAAVAAFLVVFGAAVIVAAARIPPGVPTDPLGPRLFPLTLGAGIVLCGILLAAARVLFGTRPARMGPLSDAEPDEDAEAGPFSPARLLVAVALTAAYLAAFERLGYLVATPPYVGALMLVHGGARRRSLLLSPLLTTAVLYVAFRFGLLIPLPAGILEGVLPW